MRRHSADDDDDARGSINVFAPSCHQLLIILSGSISGPVNSSQRPSGFIACTRLDYGWSGVDRCPDGKGASRYDVRIGGGEGGYGKADVVREGA